MERTFTRETDAIRAQRADIRAGKPDVSLVSFDPARGLYVYDAPCCDGTGWTGSPYERCVTHYEPMDSIWYAR